jgi:Flp pilus assembly protein TadG
MMMMALGLQVHRLISRLRRRLGELGTGGSAVETGSAIVEFVFLAVLMLVPLFYLVMVLARLQAGAYAVSAATREGGRAYATAQVPTQASARARSAAGLAFANQGFGPRETKMVIGCDAAPCMGPGGRIRITATVSVPLPLVPAFFSGTVPTRIPISATHIVTLDRFGGS